VPTTVKAYAATSATEPLTPTTVERRDIGPRAVRIDIRYAGIWRRLGADESTLTIVNGGCSAAC
jgi:hypothetical protein